MSQTSYSVRLILAVVCTCGDRVLCGLAFAFFFLFFFWFTQNVHGCGIFPFFG